jgi:hypothetical protein
MKDTAMNTRTLIAASLIALAASQTAFAQDSVAAAPVTRASVVAELQRARAAGELEAGEAYGLPAIQASASTVSRAQVVAELQRARAAGELEISDTYGVPTIRTEASTLTRAEVKSQVLAAMHDGTLLSQDERGG